MKIYGPKQNMYLISEYSWAELERSLKNFSSKHEREAYWRVYKVVLFEIEIWLQTTLTSSWVKLSSSKILLRWNSWIGIFLYRQKIMDV